MKKVSFQIKKWTARVLMAVGAMLGLTGCFRKGPIEAVYGPPPVIDTPIEVIEDVYGPPSVEEPDTVPDTELAEPSPNQGVGG